MLNSNNTQEIITANDMNGKYRDFFSLSLNNENIKIESDKTTVQSNKARLPIAVRAEIVIIIVNPIKQSGLFIKAD